jgi:hypothetical protein
MNSTTPDRADGAAAKRFSPIQRPANGMSDSRSIFMHRQIMQPPDGLVVDHINGNGLDNRWCNLRICTQRQNTHNRRRMRRSSRFVGVSRHQNKWRASICCDGKDHYLGLFDDEIEAAKARDRETLRLFGEFAYLNFPKTRQ